MGLGPGALTEVGELHSLTDWQVSEASDDAELEDFCRVEESRWLQMGAPPPRADWPRRQGREKSSGHSGGMQWASLIQYLTLYFPPGVTATEATTGGSIPGHMLQTQPKNHIF